ncbi:hypothetical protein KC19_8G102100 [Ceratodon purpureus]|uniref:ATPase, vacuolar ER assembly factor, Vma12 n=1 Tax=Ceratodon purpureus TaxID=3225 RepID=A0A8T0H1V4_CERPU|nr:hypothetical protein KC19_8G102100 [Ceratodon purpureus]
MGFQGDPRLTRLDCQSTANGLVLRSCPNIQSLLSTAARSQVLSSELRDAALQYVEADVVPYPVIRDVWVQLTPGYGVPFHQVLAGSSFVLESPKPREKSKELKDRLARLQELADKKAYSELVKDVTNNDRHEDREYFSSYKNSLGFGLHVLVIMFTGYMFGYAIVRSQFPDYPAMHAAGGVLGLIAGMLVETILFITRTSMAEKSFARKSKTELKAEQVDLDSPTESTVPLVKVKTGDIVPETEIQAELEMPFGVRKRRGVVQPPA